ncbi:MAG: CvpA family protein [Thermomicrobiaceae bacterium]|nr:CvpA family protein [Thermomicrobiaceae bacterium]
MNALDVLIIAIALLGAISGARRGFLLGVVDLALIVVGLLAAAVGYRSVAGLITQLTHRSGVAVNVVAFAVTALAVQAVLGLVVGASIAPAIRLARRVSPVRWLDSLLGVVPGAVKSLILAVLLVFVITLVPLGSTVDGVVSRSVLARELLQRGTDATNWTQRHSGLDLADFVVVTEPASEEGTRLPFSFTSGLEVRPEDEARMVALVNQERERRGLAPLRVDAKLQAVARAHSEEMLRLGYFSHVSPVSGSPLDRLTASGVQFAVAGENLAYAPTVEIAHQGLMESEGHRANILSPEFTRIGVGVVAAPNGGKMFTQEFAG